MKALIAANGELYKPEILKQRIGKSKFDLVIGVDGGAVKASMLGLKADAVVGDMDSLPVDERKSLGGAEFVTYKRDKDETDLELALAYAAKKGADSAVIVCATGGGIDLTAANILMLAED
jgi:thiamine pyrophosphokinase